MKDNLTEKFLVGMLADIAISINKAYAVFVIAGIYAIDIGFSMALFAAFAFPILTISYKKDSPSVPAWSEVAGSIIFMLIMPWVFVFVAWLASFVV